MILCAGYPVFPDAKFAETVLRYWDCVREVYFSWKKCPSGRMSMSDDAQNCLEHDLDIFRKKGVKLCLLINGNCYGSEAVSNKFAEDILGTIKSVSGICGIPDSVTTTSPFAAFVIKKNFPSIEVRASVNMRIGTVEGMTYLKDNFDGFYVQREFNRDFSRLGELRGWADSNGRKLYGLLNSGCLNFCSNQTFHDNLVAHESEFPHTGNYEGFQPVVCHRFYSDPENRKDFLKYSNWIRPEDIHLYEKYFDGGKLATRMHSHASKVIGAYARKSWPGNLAELLEPRFEGLSIDGRSSGHPSPVLPTR